MTLYKLDARNFANCIGLKIVKHSPELFEGTLVAQEAFSNNAGSLHGGAIMTIADTLGGVATVANIPKGFRTVTMESKTNFLAAIPIGDTVRAECTPVHRGRLTMIWQTRIYRGDGKLAALVTQTQIVIASKESPA